MRRGDIVVGASDGDYGKPRPVLIIQADRMADTDSVLVCPITSEQTQAVYRIPLNPSGETGLRIRSEIMVDKLQAIRRNKLRNVVGRIDPASLEQVERMLAIVLGLGERPLQA